MQLLNNFGFDASQHDSKELIPIKNAIIAVLKGLATEDQLILLAEEVTRFTTESSQEAGGARHVLESLYEQLSYCEGLEDYAEQVQSAQKLQREIDSMRSINSSQLAWASSI